MNKVRPWERRVHNLSEIGSREGLIDPVHRFDDLHLQRMKEARCERDPEVVGVLLAISCCCHAGSLNGSDSSDHFAL